MHELWGARFHTWDGIEDNPSGGMDFGQEQPFFLE